MEKVFIIAEAGVNHNGDLCIAKRLIDAAEESGADAVKFQTFSAERLVSRTAKKAEYQIEATGSEESQYEMLKKLELTMDMYQKLLAYAAGKKIQLLSTPFDEESLVSLCACGMGKIKLPSGEITNYPLLKKAAESGRPILLSSGMSTLQEVKDALEVLTSMGPRDITVLHCTTDYPASMDDINLNAMLTIKNTLNVKAGYSDHSQGIEVPIAAAALGACVIEKHFTLDRNMKGPDHKASLTPPELKAMVNAIRNVESAIGSGEKIPSQAERKNIEIVRKSIVAKCNIKKGDILSSENMTAKRPGNGISPMRWNELSGKPAVKDFDIDDCITDHKEGRQHMEQILLIGMGGHAKSVADSIEHTGIYKIAGFLDKSDTIALSYRSYQRLGSDNELEFFYNGGIKYAFVCVGFMGNSDVRHKIYERLIGIGYTVPNIIDDSAVLADDVILEDGIFIGKNVVVNAAASIGRMAIINTGSIVEHDCRIQEYSHVAVGAVICGNAGIGKNVLIGANSTIIQEIEVGDNAVIGAGSTVIRSVSPGYTVYGFHERTENVRCKKY